MKEVSEDTEFNSISPHESLIDYEYIDNLLKRMVEEGKIHGAYLDGSYFYYL